MCVSNCMFTPNARAWHDSIQSQRRDANRAQLVAIKTCGKIWLTAQHFSLSQRVRARGFAARQFSLSWNIWTSLHDIRVMTANQRSLPGWSNVKKPISVQLAGPTVPYTLQWTSAWRRKWLLPFVTPGALYIILYDIIYIIYKYRYI